MKIKAIRYAGKADVYNMEVEETHSFAVENGAIVHNCYDECRYLLMSSPIAPRVNKQAAKRVYSPLDLDIDYNANSKYSWAKMLQIS